MSKDYRPLLPQAHASASSDDLLKEKDGLEDEVSRSRFTLRRPVEFGILAVLLVLNIIGLYFNFSRSTPDCSASQMDPIWGVSGPLYSPAQSAVRYERRVFDELGTKTIYHGPPTDETDKAWDDLYYMGLSYISAEEAALLPNRTEPLPNDKEGRYAISLDVFHQIHCLNYVRRALWPERYGPPEMGPPGIVIGSDTEPFDHTDHCVNILRENILCNADITPNVWQWDESRGVSFPHFDSIHTCRNFDAIRDWAMARKIDRVWNASIHVGHEHGH